MSRLKFYICRECGTILTLTAEGRETPGCCSGKLEELVANTVDAAREKHVPVVTVEGNRVHVAVGSVAHPMLEAHYIEFITLETKNGSQCKPLKPGDKPEAVFALAEGDEAVAAYEYCNLHGLWKKEV